MASLFAGCARSSARPDPVPSIEVRLVGQESEPLVVSPTATLPICDAYAERGVSLWWVPRGSGKAVLLARVEDAEFYEELASGFERSLEPRALLEEELRAVAVAKRDTGTRYEVVFGGVGEPTISWLHTQLTLRVRNNPQAASRVTVVREGEQVVMRLPEGGPVVRSRTSVAADEIVARWAQRQPTRFSVERSGDRFVTLTVEAPDATQLEETRLELVHAFGGACEASAD